MDSLSFGGALIVLVNGPEPSLQTSKGAEAPSWESVAQSDSEAWCLIEGDSKKVRLWRPLRRCAVHLDPMGTADHLGDSFAAEAAARSLR